VREERGQEKKVDWSTEAQQQTACVCWSLVHLPLPAPTCLLRRHWLARAPQPVREVVRPAAQLALTAAELEEEIGLCLTAGNPAAPANIVRYSYRERTYRPEPIIDQQLQHFALGGCLLHRQSGEAAHDSAALLAQSRRATQQPQAEGSSLHAEPSSSACCQAPQAPHLPQLAKPMLQPPACATSSILWIVQRRRGTARHGSAAA
jgi:hypothetical protein